MSIGSQTHPLRTAVFSSPLKPTTLEYLLLALTAELDVGLVGFPRSLNCSPQRYATAQSAPGQHCCEAKDGHFPKGDPGREYGSRSEPPPRYRDAMHTLYFWRHTYPLTGRRATTRFHLTEEDAKRTLIDPERIDYGAITVEALALAPSGTWISGLVMNENGAMAPKP